MKDFESGEVRSTHKGFGIHTKFVSEFLQSERSGRVCCGLMQIVAKSITWWHKCQGCPDQLCHY